MVRFERYKKHWVCHISIPNADSFSAFLHALERFPATADSLKFAFDGALILSQISRPTDGKGLAE